MKNFRLTVSDGQTRVLVVIECNAGATKEGATFKEPGRMKGEEAKPIAVPQAFASKDFVDASVVQNAIRELLQPDTQQWTLRNATGAPVSIDAIHNSFQPNMRYLFIIAPVNLADFTVRFRTCDWTAMPGRQLPPCLCDGNVDKDLKVMTHNTTTASRLPCSSHGEAAVPSPGYWPVSKVYFNSSSLEAFMNQWQGPKPEFERITAYNTGTFLRDYLVHMSNGTVIATTKKNGKSPEFAQSMGISVFESDLPASANNSGFGFGGNFLTCEVNGEWFLFHGACEHQTDADDKWMVDTIVQQSTAPITTVAIDTGWLKVGHIDELISFPRPGYALLADARQGATLCPCEAAEELIQRIESKLDIVAAYLNRLGLKVIRIPVSFRAMAGDPDHVVSHIGNAVNCIYLEGPTSLHSCCTEAINQVVEREMTQLGYTAKFLDMRAANDEGGAGGNVHCATFTIHTPQQGPSPRLEVSERIEEQSDTSAKKKRPREESHSMDGELNEKSSKQHKFL